jgi:Zn finger protein HypA/HybF involved in hydrogenase expression
MPKKITTEIFIERAIAIHGEKYSYEKVEYKSAKEKVVIICKKHEEYFEQSPVNHLNGNGCPLCAGTKKLTKEDFIKKAIVVHNEKYSYEKVEYVNNCTKVKIWCNKHEEFFEQTPASHLQGKGCPSCSGNKKLTTQEFIEKSIQVHGYKYSYEKSICSGIHNKLIITCDKHGDFEQIPASHLSGKGCSSCGGRKKLTKEIFIERAIAIHGEKYSYEKVEYKSANEKVVIICSAHGPFRQTPNKHTSLKQGCPSCGGTKKLAAKGFIERAKSVHADRYDYSKVEYKSAREKVFIICQEHGIFEQIPASHLNGIGCPSCAKSGFNPDKAGYLYILKATKFNYIKIGISNNPEQRFKNLKREAPFNFEALTIKEFQTGQEAYDLEQSLHKQLKHLNAGLSGFDGCTEWFKYNSESCEALEKTDILSESKLRELNNE